MNKLIILCAILMSSCWSQLGTQNRPMYDSGRSACKKQQKELSRVYGRNLHGPNTFKRKHF